MSAPRDLRGQKAERIPKSGSRFSDQNVRPSKLVVASHNAGKVRDLGLPEPEETGLTFQANAELKARAAAEASGLLALADDSGLAVTALNGDPGIYSARWAGPSKDFSLAMEKVEQALKETGSEDRSAAFICGLALATPGGEMDYFEGRVEGSLVWPPRGDKGFGYDPVFVANGYDITFAEMEPDAKHAISHRADAFRQLTDVFLK